MTTLTIDRQERDVLWQASSLELGGLGDVRMMFQDGRGSEAREYFHRRFRPTLRILDDLGWDDDESRTSFGITISAGDLRRFLRRQCDVAADDLRYLVSEERGPDAERSATAIANRLAEPGESVAVVRRELVHNMQEDLRRTIDEDLELLHVTQALLARLDSQATVVAGELSTGGAG